MFELLKPAVGSVSCRNPPASSLFVSVDELTVDQPYAVLKAPKVWGALRGKRIQPAWCGFVYV